MKVNKKLQLLSSLLLGLSLSIYYWLGSFIISQSASVFRNILLSSEMLKIYMPIGLVVGLIIFVFIKKSTKTFIVISASSLALSVILWWLVTLPVIQQYLLPPATVK